MSMVAATPLAFDIIAADYSAWLPPLLASCCPHADAATPYISLLRLASCHAAAADVSAAIIAYYYAIAAFRYAISLPLATQRADDYYYYAARQLSRCRYCY